MALDIYWKDSRTHTWIGSLNIDDSLENLLHEFGKVAGVPIDPYGKARLYLVQWERLIQLAWLTKYPAQQLVDIRERIPANQPDGLIMLYGD